MERKLVTIQKISEITPIQGADKIETATVLGWKSVVSKNEHKVGELIVFVEIDSLFPENTPEVEFLRESKWRVRTRRFKQQISQGLVLSLSVLNGKKFSDDTRENPTYEWKEGQDVTSLLGVSKYEPYIPPNLAGEVKGLFPGFLVKSDQVRAQILRPLLEKYKGTKCSVSEKIDGSSVTFFIKGTEFGVCSRNLELKETPENTIWKWVRQHDIENKLKEWRTANGDKDLAIQGEIIGPGINGNTLNLKYIDVYFYDAFDIATYKYYDVNTFKIILENKLKLKTVPIVYYDFTLIDNIDELVKLSIGKSKINVTGEREGIVVRPITEIYDTTVMDENNGRITFKIINQEYLLKHEK
jgi:RNA ligase (TIGR02306 family)